MLLAQYSGVNVGTTECCAKFEVSGLILEEASVTITDHRWSSRCSRVSHRG